MTHHATKTFRGQSACAGSGTTDITKTAGGYGNVCPVCNRNNIGRVHGTGSLSTHLHMSDLAKTSQATSAVTPPAPKAKRVFTHEQQAAMVAFFQDESVETFAAMTATGANDTSEYIGWGVEAGYITY